MTWGTVRHPAYSTGSAVSTSLQCQQLRKLVLACQLKGTAEKFTSVMILVIFTFNLLIHFSHTFCKAVQDERMVVIYLRVKKVWADVLDEIN